MAEPYGVGAVAEAPAESALTDSGVTSTATDDFQMPEKFLNKSAQDIARSYVENERWFNQRLSELEPIINVNKQLENYGGVQALVEGYTQLWNSYQQLMQNPRQVQQQQQQTPPQSVQRATQGTQPMAENFIGDDWDYLPPRTQAERLYANLLQRLQNDMSQGANQLYQQAYQQLQNQMQGQQDLLRRQFDVSQQVGDYQRRYPDIDRNTLLQKSVEISQYGPDQLMSLAAQILTNQDEQNVKSQAQKMFDQWKADAETEMRNRQISTFTSGGGTPFGEAYNANQNAPTNPDEKHRMIIQSLLDDPNSGIDERYL